MQRFQARLVGLALAASFIAHSAPAAHAGDGKASLQLLPYDTAVVAVINVDRVNTTVAFADLVRLLGANSDIAAGLDTLKDQAGFEVDKHLHTIVVGMPDGFDKSGDLIVVLEGTFDQKKLTKLALEAGESALDYRGVKYFESSDKQILFLTDAVIITDRASLMSNVIDVHLAKARSVLANPGVMDLANAGDTSLDAWMAMVLPADLRADLSRQIGGSTINGMMVSVDVQNGFAARMTLTTPSKSDATTLSTTINGAISQLKSDRTFQQLGLATALDSVAVTQAKSTLELNFVLTPTEFTIIRQLVGAFI